MDNLSIYEALVAELAERDDVDSTNAIALLRNAAAAVAEYTGGVAEALHTLRTADEVDDILILVSENGRRDLFA